MAGMQDEIKPYIYYIPSMTDKALILAYQSGDNSALAELYRRYKERLLWFLYQYVQDEDEAEDLVQETFLHFIKNRSNYTPSNEMKVSSWFYLIAKGRLSSQKTKENRLKRSGEEISKDKEETPVSLRSNETSPDQKLHLQMRIDRVKQKMKTINPRYAEALRLRCFEGYDYKEIAEIMDTSLGTVKSQIYRGRKALQ